MSNQHFSFGKPSLIVRNLHPENQETPIHFIMNTIINQALFFRRNHFSYPKLTYANYWLPVAGMVKKPILFSMEDILNLPSKQIKVFLECAGNKRNLFKPKVFGEQWEKGAISQGYWKGVSLQTLLMSTGIKSEAKEVVVDGFDFGKTPALDQVHYYSRSLPIEKALHPDTIIAYEYNGQPIPFKHGYPFRLIVPQWYGMASVKWIKQIRLIDHHFQGPFQTKDYIYYPYKETDEDSFPVTTVNVNSIIQSPLNLAILNLETHVINGIAWTGKGSILKVEISTDNGTTWSEAELNNKSSTDYEWTSWFFKWSPPEKGEYTLLSRATDSQQRTQPSEPFWNRKGYGYNAIERVKVKVE